MKPERAKEILGLIRKTSIAVYGDFCLDAYWTLDPRGSEVSVETGCKGDAVMKHSYSLGGASNVVANLAALKPASISAIGAVGGDIFGRELVHMMSELGVDTSAMVTQADRFDTVVYCKRILDGQEQSRVDFGMYNQRTAETDSAILSGIEKALKTCDVVVINQQVPGSIPDEAFIKGINSLARKFPSKTLLLDTRHYGPAFSGLTRKTNAVEAAYAGGLDVEHGDIVNLHDLRRCATEMSRKDGKPIFVTRGARGLLVADGKQITEIPGIQVMKKTDPVGAGDTILSALACCLGAGVPPVEAAEFANFAATVTVQKLYTTGTASPDEILQVASDHDYVYQPELSEDIRQAVIVAGTEIELCADKASLALGKISHAVFDHDGTVSTLREGWEAVMEPMMVRAILGSQYKSADEALYHKVRNRVLDYIEKSTGIQTVEQMEALIEMVREFGIVPAGEILEKFGYKAVYNTALLEKVDARRAKLERNELDVGDWTMKGAVEFLKALRKRGVTLYLASGTDRDDVIAEAKALGYADLFNGGMYGAVGDVKEFSKRMVIEKILRENNLQGPQMACFGDGPVEMRECRKHDGIAVGIASDEVRRHGLHSKKRERLIKAGAHIIIPDFSQWQQLLQLLFPV